MEIRGGRSISGKAFALCIALAVHEHTCVAASRVTLIKWCLFLICRQFPEIYGAVTCRGGQVHFWDAPDDVRDIDMQMVRWLR
jgi:hypothetical protein